MAVQIPTSGGYAAGVRSGQDFVAGIEQIKSNMEQRRSLRQQNDETQRNIDSGLTQLRRDNLIKEEEFKSLQLSGIAKIYQENPEAANVIWESGFYNKVFEEVNKRTLNENQHMLDVSQKLDAGTLTYEQAKDLLANTIKGLNLPEDSEQGKAMLAVAGTFLPESVAFQRKLQQDKLNNESELQKLMLKEDAENNRTIFSEAEANKRNQSTIESREDIAVLKGKKNVTLEFADGRPDITALHDPATNTYQSVDGRNLTPAELRGGTVRAGEVSNRSLTAQQKREQELRKDLATSKSLMELGHSLFFDPDLRNIAGQFELRGHLPSAFRSSATQKMMTRYNAFSIGKVLPIVRTLAPVDKTDFEKLLTTMPPLNSDINIMRGWYVDTFLPAAADMIEASSDVNKRFLYAKSAITGAMDMGVSQDNFASILDGTLPDIRDYEDLDSFPMGSYVNSSNKVFTTDVLEAIAITGNKSVDQYIQEQGLRKIK